MPAMFGGTPIGAMQYGGTPIAEAMIDGVVVWRRIITVTPLPPTFHDGEPWITLPTVEGVTYTVAGQPGAGESVTVTAQPEDGYVLEGQTVWTHEWPLPRYTASGSRTSRQRISRNTWTTMDSHTVTHAGIASGHWQVVWSLANRHTYSIRVRRGTTVIAMSDNHGGGITEVVQRVTIPETELAAGDTLTFQAHTTHTLSMYRDIDVWSWNLS